VAAELKAVRMRREIKMNGASTTVSTTINIPRDQFFYWFLSVDPPKFLHRYAILPAVVEARNQTGPMYVPGSTREFVFSDGTTASEEIVGSDPPKSVHYRIFNLTSIFRYLVREGNASFDFDELQSGGTQIEWRYTFTGHNWLANLILQPLVSILWRGFMQSALSRAKQISKEVLSISDP
jgi:hypothetical protein